MSETVALALIGAAAVVFGSLIATFGPAVRDALAARSAIGWAEQQTHRIEVYRNAGLNEEADLLFKDMRRRLKADMARSVRREGASGRSSLLAGALVTAVVFGLLSTFLAMGPSSPADPLPYVAGLTAAVAIFTLLVGTLRHLRPVDRRRDGRARRA